MGVRFDASADRLVITADVLDYNAAYTVMGWIYISVDTNDYANFVAMSDNSVDNADFVTASADGTTFSVGRTNGGQASFLEDTGTALSTATWHHVAMTRSGDVLTGYLNGVQDCQLDATISGRTAATRLEMGGATTDNLSIFDGRAFAAKFYSATLTEAEIAQEAHTIRPHRTADLYGWWPILPGSAERLRDYSDSGHHWTELGTLTDEDHAPVSWGAPVLVIPGQGAGGVTETLNVAGTVASSGALVMEVHKRLAGADTPTGSLVKAMTTTYTGSAASSGALTKQAETSYAGTVTSSGALDAFKTALLSVAGAVTSSGALVKAVSHTLTGTVTSAGTLIKSIAHSLAGTVTSAGSLAKQTSVNLAASTTPMGALTKQARRLWAGVVSIAGTLAMFVPGADTTGTIAITESSNSVTVGEAASTITIVEEP